MRAELARAQSSDSGILKSRNQPRRDGAAAGLDAAGAVEQQHLAAGARQVLRGGRARGAAADDDDVERLRLYPAMDAHPRAPSIVRAEGVTVIGADGASSREARTAEARKIAASPTNTARKAGAVLVQGAAHDVDADRADEAAAGEGGGLGRAPTTPIRTPSRPPPPAPARPIIEPMAETANTPLAKPSTNTVGASGQAGADHARRRHPAQRHRRTEAARDGEAPHPQPLLVAEPRAQHADQHHAQKHAPVLKAGQLRRLAGRHAEHQPRERLEDQLLRAVGQHGDEDEDREPPRQPVGPTSAPAPPGTAAWRAAARRPRSPCRRPPRPQTASRVTRKATPATPEGHRRQALGR